MVSLISLVFFLILLIVTVYESETLYSKQPLRH